MELSVELGDFLQGFCLFIEGFIYLFGWLQDTNEHQPFRYGLLGGDLSENQAVNEIYHFYQLHPTPIVWHEWVDIIEPIIFYLSPYE